MKRNKTSEDGGYYAIKGFLYQYDATLLKIMETLSAEDCVSIESVQDFSVKDEIYQLKYKESQNYANSKIKKALKQLLDIWINSPQLKYVLIVYFKNRQKGKEVLTTEKIKKILGKETAEYSNDDLKRFSNKFSLIWGEDYKSQINRVLKSILRFSKTKEKASLWHFWMSRYLLEKVTQNKNKSDRVCSRKELLDNIKKNDQKYFDVAYKEFLGKKKYFAYIKKEVFPPKFNTNSEKRLFILESISNEDKNTIVSALQLISEKFVKKTSNNLVGDAPYIFLKNLSNELLIGVKESLYNKQIQFVDGYPFQGSCFKIEVLQRKFKDKKDGLRMRIINTEEDLEKLEHSYWDEIYDFSLTGTRKPLQNETKIHIDHIKEINHIL